MAVLTSMDKVREFIGRFNELNKNDEGYEWINWNYFVSNGIYILLYDDYMKIITRDGIYITVELNRNHTAVKIGSIAESYCECSCGE